MIKIKILVVCNYGMGTSTMAELNIKKALVSENIKADLQHTSIGELDSLRNWADIICISKNLENAANLKPTEHVVSMVNIMDGPGIVKEIAKFVDEFYPEAREQL